MIILTFSINILVNELCYAIINKTNIYLLKFNNRNIRKRHEICSKLTIKKQNNVVLVFLL